MVPTNATIGDFAAVWRGVVDDGVCVVVVDILVVRDDNVLCSLGWYWRLRSNRFVLGAS